MRLENTWQEIRDHSFIQNLSRPFRFTAPWRCFFSSAYSLIFYRVLVRGLNGQQKLGFVISDPFLCCFWNIVRLEDPNMAHYMISNRISHLLIFVSVGILYNPWCHVFIKMSRTSSRNIGPQHKKYSSIFHCTMGYFLSPCSPNPSWVFAAKKQFVLVSSDHRSQSHLKFQSCLTTEYAGVCF